MQVGDRVELHGLTGSSEHNGSWGTILGFKGDRVIVVIDGSGKVCFDAESLLAVFQNRTSENLLVKKKFCLITNIS